MIIRALHSKKKLKTKASKSSRKERATAQVPLNVKPIYVAPPDNREHRLVIHEHTSTEAPESEEIPSVDPNTAEDIGREDNVNDDEVLPQIEPNPVVSFPAPTSSELISIGRPLTPRPMASATQDMPVDDEAIMCTPLAQVTTPVLETQQEIPNDFDFTIPYHKCRLPSGGFVEVPGLRHPCQAYQRRMCNQLAQ